MTYAMLSELSDALDEGAADDEARALILAGVPGAFCAAPTCPTCRTRLRTSAAPAVEPAGQAGCRR